MLIIEIGFRESESQEEEGKARERGVPREEIYWEKTFPSKEKLL